MATKFESIFTDSNVKPSLNKLFSRKAKAEPKAVQEEEEVEAESKPLNDEVEEKKVKKFDAEYESRTVFVGNLKVACKKEELVKIFKPFGKIDSVRFRNIVPEDITKSKKYAFITKQQHPNKTTINAFVRFKDKDSATNAAKEVNGMEYNGLHLRVDIATKTRPADTNKRSLFLGGLPFDVSDEDVYKHFSTCGPIDYVRIIRDNKTGIGKGFGYVAFQTEDTNALGIKLDGSTLNGRKIRVTRCVKKQKAKKEDKSQNNTKDDSFRGKKPKKKFNRDRDENNSNGKKFKRSSNESEPKSNGKKFKKSLNESEPKQKKFKKSQAPASAKPTESKAKPSKENGKRRFDAKKNKKTIAKKRHVSTNNKSGTTFKF